MCVLTCTLHRLSHCRWGEPVLGRGTGDEPVVCCAVSIACRQSKASLLSLSALTRCLLVHVPPFRPATDLLEAWVHSFKTSVYLVVRVQPEGPKRWQ